MTFIEVLNSEHYNLIEQIEEIGNNTDLVSIKENLIKELKEKTGFIYKD